MRVSFFGNGLHVFLTVRGFIPDSPLKGCALYGKGRGSGHQDSHNENGFVFVLIGNCVLPVHRISLELPPPEGGRRSTVPTVRERGVSCS